LVAFLAIEVRRAVTVIVPVNAITSSGGSLEAPVACMPLVSAYSSTLGSGSAIILIAAVALEVMTSCIMVFCASVMGVGSRMGARAWFQVPPSLDSLTPRRLASLTKAFQRFASTGHISALVMSRTSPLGAPAAA